MTKEEHRKRHELLHQYLDELVADFVIQTGKLLAETTVMEFLDWSVIQTKNPDGKIRRIKNI